MGNTRRENDFLGEMDVPEDAYYGVQTQRAVENFDISGTRMPAIFHRACAEIKKAAAAVHEELGLLEADVADAVVRAADEVIAGSLDGQFVVDVFQAGAGTSCHMNVNEVIANRANEILGGSLGAYDPVHPNDHVNMGQSTNDVFPTAMRIAALMTIPDLMDGLEALGSAFRDKAVAFAGVVKSGRTHLQDAVPVTLGQEFSGYAAAVETAARRIGNTAKSLRRLGLGGSATGTGLNTHPDYRGKVVDRLAAQTGLALSPAENLFEAMQSMAPFVAVSGALRSSAVDLGRISNDLRLLASGPTTGLGEIVLPAVQPGSSIMPGKVNPVIAECMNMICFQAIGNDACIAQAAAAGQLELNVMMPVIIHNLLESIRILTNGVRMLRERCVVGIEAREDRCADYAAATLGNATVLNPVIGYHGAADVVREALARGESIHKVVIDKGILTAEELDRLIMKSLGNEE